MELYACKVWSANRLTKKTFMSSATIESVISEATLLGIPGSKLVLESDGSEICSNMVLEYYLKSNSILMLLENNEWTERTTTAQTSGNEINAATTDMLINSENTAYSTSNIFKAIPINISMDNNNSEENNESNNSLILLSVESTDVDTDSTITTMTMSSGALSTNSETTESAKQLFQHFKIPWQKVPSDIMDMLIKRKSLGKRLNGFANLLVDELRTSSFYLPLGILRSVTQQAIAMYPDSFLDKDTEGNVISSTTVPLLTVMRNRNNFLNRAPNVSEDNSKIPIKHRRRSNLLQKTCSNWQPKDTDTPQLSSSSEYKKKILNSLYGKKNTWEEKQQISTYMKDCYVQQRTYFNCMDPIPTIENIKKEWPYIFEREYIHQHFEKLMSMPSISFISNFKKSQPQFLRFFQKYDKSDLLETDQPEEVNIISSVITYFGEDLSFLQKNFEFGTSMDEIVKEIPTNTPFMAFVKREIGQQKEMTYIFIEKFLVASIDEENDNYLNSLMDVINYYYVFNIMFPRQLSQTMEFLVRFFYKHYPNSSRGPKKNINNLQKVNNLISKISKS